MFSVKKEFHVNGPVLLDTAVFRDERGYFMETYNQEDLKRLIGDVTFVQQNISCSKRNMLRGLHFQKPPHAQAKLVRVIRGSGFDVAVDIRVGSPTYGEWCGVYLSEANARVFYIPVGYAHGFLALEDNTLLNYNCSDVYHKECEGSLKFDDRILDIKWDEWGDKMSFIVSPKDCEASFFGNDFSSPFIF